VSEMAVVGRKGIVECKGRRRLCKRRTMCEKEQGEEEQTANSVAFLKGPDQWYVMSMVNGIRDLVHRSRSVTRLPDKIKELQDTSPIHDGQVND